MEKNFSVKHLDELREVAERLALEVQNKTVILLCGPLGAGKTQWTKFFLKALRGEEALSPSFSLQNVYETPRFPVHHFDLYRLETMDEIESSGLWDAFSDDGLIIVEWAERLGETKFSPEWTVWELHFEKEKKSLKWLTRP